MDTQVPPLDPSTLDTETPEIFTFMCGHFDVREAKRLIAASPRDTEMVPLAPLREFIGRVAVSRSRVKSDPKIDTAVPLIVAELDASCLPIDGWHRIARALDQGIEELPALHLTRDESEAVRG